MLVNTILKRRQRQNTLLHTSPVFLPFIFSFFHSLSLFCSFFPFFVQGLMKISKTCASQMVELPPAPPASHPTTMHKPISSCTCPRKVFVSFWKTTQSDVLGTSAVQEPGWLVLPPFLRLIDGCFLTGRQSEPRLPRRRCQFRLWWTGQPGRELAGSWSLRGGNPPWLLLCLSARDTTTTTMPYIHLFCLEIKMWR